MARHVQHPATTTDWRFAPTPKWIRARRDGQTIADTRRALLVWEPGMPFPWYAFPRDDAAVAGVELEEPELVGYAMLRWDDAEEWLEEDEPVVGHARDPYHRVDARRSSRTVRIELDGAVLAESDRPVLLFETNLPMRSYLPAEDVRMDLLLPSDTRTTCAYKGHADHFSTATEADVAWTYAAVLPDGPDVAGLIAFYDERVDVIVDGERRARPRTAWSRRPPSRA